MRCLGLCCSGKALIKMSLGLVAQILPCHDHVTARDSLKVLPLGGRRDENGSRKDRLLSDQGVLLGTAYSRQQGTCGDGYVQNGSAQHLQCSGSLHESARLASSLWASLCQHLAPLSRLQALESVSLLV